MKCRLEFRDALKTFDKDITSKYGPDKVVDMSSFKTLKILL